MKNHPWVFPAIASIGIFIAGCRNAQPITIETVPEPTAKFTSMPTPVPTWTPLSLVVPPTATLSPLPHGIFEPFPEQFYDNTVKMAFGLIFSGSTVEEPVLIDTSIGHMRFSIFWRVGDLDVTLIQPDGTLINPTVADSDRYISFSTDSFAEEYGIQAPQAGLWTVKISAKSTPVSGSHYMLEASAFAATRISANFDQEEYSAGDPIKLSASIEDSISAAPKGPEYIYGVRWQVIVEGPTRTQYSFELYDDGRHGDGAAEDGVYANVFEETLLSGKYNFYIQISGLNNRGYMNHEVGTQFTRVYFRSTVVR